MSLSLRIKLYPGPSKNQNQRNAIFFRYYVLKLSNGLHTRSHSAQVVNYSEISSAKTATHSPTSVRRQCHAGERLATFRDNVEPGWITPPLTPLFLTPPSPSASSRTRSHMRSSAGARTGNMTDSSSANQRSAEGTGTFCGPFIEKVCVYKTSIWNNTNIYIHPSILLQSFLF